MGLKEKLEAAGQKAQDQKEERRARAVKGSHLTEEIAKLVADSGLKTKDNTGFTIVFGNNGRKLCVAKKGGRIDVSGFDLVHDAVTLISADDAKAKHLGKVRGQVDFDKGDEEVLAAVRTGVAALQEPEVEKQKPAAKPKKEKKAAAAPEATVPGTSDVTGEPDEDEETDADVAVAADDAVSDLEEE